MRVLLAAAAGLLLSRCILVVSEDVPESGPQCRFAGADSQCGRCIASACQTEVDACCTDKSCDPTLALLESCSVKTDASCPNLKANGSTLAACVSTHCDAVCQELSGPGITSCKEPALGEGAACECSVSSAPNDFVCSSAAYPKTKCCAPAGGWPVEGFQCACLPLNCSPTQDGCLCSFADFVPTQQSCGAGNCCVDRDTCICRQTQGCYAWETPVPSCSIEVMGCAEGQEEVESCSRRAP